jgi:DNA-binding GntR family transcriptional regulator
MIIEPAAILEPTFRIDRALFDRVRREQEQLLDGGIERWTAAERFRAGSEFHEALVACSNNRFLIDALRTVNQSRRLIEYTSQTGSVQDRARMRRQCEEHLQLLDMLEAVSGLGRRTGCASTDAVSGDHGDLARSSAWLRSYNARRVHL